MPGDAFNEDFRAMLECLLARDVEFVIVGAWALASHGYPRATADFDILVRPSAENARRVFLALRDFGAPLDVHQLTEDDLARPGVVYQMGMPPRRIDILTEVSGVSFEEAWLSRHEKKLGDLTLPFLGREALIKNKRASARPKDLADVAALERKSPPAAP
jgi:hypothetical protein